MHFPPPPTAADRVLIIGGGLAGIAAAVALTQAGVPVLLLESRRRLAGRAGSFEDQTSGEVIDTCQHVSLGCCTNLRALCETLGVAGFFRTAKGITFVDPEGRFSSLRAAPLPAPLHLAPSFAALSFLTWGEKLALARGLRQLAREPSAGGRGEPFLAWLRRNRQPPRVIERFWEVVLISALSESLDRIDVRYARKVFVDSFLRNRDGWRMQVPTVPLEQVFGQPVIDWLYSRGSEVQLNARVIRLHGGIDGIERAELRDGTQPAAQEFLLAVPHHQVAVLLPPSIAERPEVKRLDQIDTAPISSVHLWFDRPITSQPQVAFVGRLSQWLFQPEQHAGEPGESRWRYQIVISASRSLVGVPQETVLQQVLADLRAAWPMAASAELLHWRLVTDHRAVFSATPGIDALRPPQQSPVANLQFAGDWTRTGWPSTMEGAVRSGFLAAGNVLRRLGRPARVLRVDLPTTWLSRLLLRLPREDQVSR